MPPGWISMCWPNAVWVSGGWHTGAFRSPGSARWAFRIRPILESQPLAWLRNWPGGFLTPCGLTQVGSPDMDDGNPLGIHGRVANLPAHNLSWGADWQNEAYTVWVEGTLHETAVFGENLTLKRRIWTDLNEPRFWIEDRVENHGFSPAPHMFLQHINLGFPLVSPATRLELPEHVTIPRDEPARLGLERCCQFDEPIHAYQEQVFYHELQPDSQGQVEVRLFNPAVQPPVWGAGRFGRIPALCEG